MTEPKDLAPEREQTDESLRTERRNLDDAIAARKAEVDRSADAVVEQARERADELLDSARQEADQVQEQGRTESQPEEAVAAERVLAREILQTERDAADAVLERERVEHARMLAKLLPLERQKTDRHLLTERSRSDDAVAHRDDFMGMVSHDLRNILSTILTDATLLATTASSNEEGQRTVAGMQRLQRHVARMNRLIGDLLDVVSIDAGKLAVHPEPCDVGALLNEAVQAFAGSAAEKQLALEAQVEVAGEPTLLQLDGTRLLQVLGNLLSNAIKFTPAGGRIVARAATSHDAVLFTVTDNGVGIPEEMRDSVFERFWQQGKNDRRGLGLGLYISSCIVEAHGGTLSVESTVGEGSTFSVAIPVAPAA